MYNKLLINLLQLLHSSAVFVWVGLNPVDM